MCINNSCHSICGIAVAYYLSSPSKPSNSKPKCCFCLTVKATVIKYIVENHLLPPSIKDATFRHVHIPNMRRLCNLQPAVGTPKELQNHDKAVSHDFRDLAVYTTKAWGLKNGLVRRTPADSSAFPQQVAYEWCSDIVIKSCSTVDSVEQWLRQMGKRNHWEKIAGMSILWTISCPFVFVFGVENQATNKTCNILHNRPADGGSCHRHKQNGHSKRTVLS